MEELANEDTQNQIGFWYEMVVDEQKREMREYKKKLKKEAELAPLVIEPDTPHLH